MRRHIVAGEFHYGGKEASTRWAGDLDRSMTAEAGALGRVTVSSPAVMRPLAKLNERKKYGDQIKPFNFLLACHVKAFGHPPGVDLTRFHLISPYEANSSKWLKQLWIDQYSGQQYRITTAGHHGARGTVRVRTYGDVLVDYESLLSQKNLESTSRC